MKKIVVSGGVAAGLKAAAKARRCDPQAQITESEKSCYRGSGHNTLR
ncbi:MAG: hypothetical protein H6Q72_350 [Firmicutes bacterium]|nr:hypothetical protein [Bacillota bacterium]